MGNIQYLVSNFCLVNMINKLIILLMIIGLLFPTTGFGAMSSTDYFIFADSINVGGIYSTGGSYILQDTLGEIAVGTSTGGTYDIKAGYQSMERGYITLALSNSTINLGTLSVGAISSSTATATVSTDSATGYSLSVGSFNADSGLPSIGIGGTVTAGTAGIGLAVSGPQAATASDIDLNSPFGQVLASASVPIDNSQTVVAVKASISSATTITGDFHPSVLLTASANL